MKTEWLDAEDKNSWDCAVDQYSNSEVYHLFDWAEIIQETYKVKTFRLVVKENENILAALPIIFFNSPLFGKKLVSLPFCDYGGFFGNMENKEIIMLLLKEIARLAHSLEANFVELRMLSRKDESLTRMRFVRGITALTYRLKADRSYSEILSNVYSAKVRKDLRRAEREGLEVKEASKRNDLEIFYGIYLRRMIELGTPPAPKMFWTKLWDHFHPQRLKLIFTMKEDNPIAAFIALIHKRRLYLLLNVSDSRQWGLRGLNDVLYDWYIRFACENGLQDVDFGRTRHGTGVMEFKEKGWGGMPIEVCKYYLFLRGNENLVDKSIQSGIYAKAWRRFVPRIVSPALGYIVRKNIGDA